MLSRDHALLLVALLLCPCLRLVAQADTIFIYEDVMVYDTIFVRDTIFMHNLPPIKPLDARMLGGDCCKTLPNYGRVATTFPKKSIISNENKLNTKGMRKLSFFGALLLAGSTATAQTGFEVSLGGGAWWEAGMPKYVSRPISPVANIASHFRWNIAGSRFGLRVGLEYAYLFSTGRYSGEGVISNNYIYDDLNDYYGNGMHGITLPLMFSFDLKWFQPYVGVNYNHLLSNRIQSRIYEDFYYYFDSNNCGLMVGAFVNLGDSFMLNVGYRRNVTDSEAKFMLRRPDAYDVISTYNAQTTISLIYRFKGRSSVAPLVVE